MSLKDQIDQARRDVAMANHRLRAAEQHLKEVEALQVSCPHQFSKPMTNFEHEGGYCIKCGCNELYAYTLEQRRKVLLNACS